MTTSCSGNTDLSFLKDNLSEIKENIALAAEKAGRKPEEIRLMAVTKTVTPDKINYLLSEGIELIGENKVQELTGKLEFLRKPLPEMHIIGHLQSNKVRKIIDTVSCIQSVDSVSLGREISRQAQLHNKTMEILLEVNIGAEEAKTGIPIASLKETAAEIAEMKGIAIKGLMCVPPICTSEAEARKYFSHTRNLYEELASLLKESCSFNTLSMGMSGDYALAVTEGATLVRVGSALFGARTY